MLVVEKVLVGGLVEDGTGGLSACNRKSDGTEGGSKGFRVGTVHILVSKSFAAFAS
jgi:hypothetical protein